MAVRMDLCLEALSALTGCRVEASAAESQLMPQDVVNIAALKQFYRREGLQELEYPSLGSLSLGGPDDEDMYSAPLAVEGPPPPEPLEGPPIKINPATFFDPRFDYDFTNVKDGEQSFSRGEERYVRPCGWRRVALRVLGYDGGDAWLGTGPDAWPVSYHGNRMDGALGVTATRRGPAPEGAEPGALEEIEPGPVAGATYLRGVYSSTLVGVAEGYCKRFRSCGDGKTYKVVLQNRINPEQRRQCQREGLWVVTVAEGSGPAQTRASIQLALRPYGLLLKED
ncbi:uncharacterized protein LOC115535289 [Gadus morhua]|uniref:uncharacterized protein LOC115535289 n=1 Tax=Gadus morhua TaxID=8049 RepID=UPI0011B605A3|nr:uncharacterized protein LOC115535289 [Gadus morhua]